ncbi:MAG: hypothetical protein ABIK83_08140 [Candidatus Zixiibacteriota bacterium]
MSIDYFGLVKKSLRIAWEYKFLWLFGFFVVAADGSGGMASHISNLSGIDTRSSFFSDFDFDPSYIAPGVIIMVVLALLFMALLFWIMSVLSEGALIHGILKKESGGSASFSECWSRGVDKFWSVFGVLLLATIAAVTVVIGIILFLIPAFIASVALGIILVIVALPVILAVIFIVEALLAWSIRLIVIDDKPWFDSIGDSWKMIRQHFGKTFGIAFSSVLTQLVIGIIFFLSLLVVAIPFVIIGIQSPLLGIIPGIITAIVLIAFLSAYEGVFRSTIWTLAYMQLTGRDISLGNTVPGGDLPAPDPSDGSGI